MLATLGNPFMKISGESETFTYQLEAGEAARIEVESGRVVKIKIAN